MINYAVFWETIKSHNITTYRLIQDKIITPGTVQYLRDNKPIRTDTINKLCNYIGCTPDEIMTYTPDDTTNKV